MKIQMSNQIKSFVLACLNSLILVFMLGLASCSSSSSSSVTPSSATTAFTNATAKPIFDTYCASCHASGKSNYKDWLYNAADYASIKNNIGTIYSVVYVKKTMPQGTTMSTADLAVFKKWYDGGYLAN